MYYSIAKEQRPVLEQDNVRVQQVDGTPLDVLGVAWTEVKVGKTIFPVKVIFANIRNQVILGMDFLIPTAGVLDFFRLELILNGEHIRCLNQIGRSFLRRILVKETIEVQPGQETLAQGEIANCVDEMTGTAIIEPVAGGGELARHGLVLARSLVTAEADVLPLRLFNPGNNKITLRQGTMVGMISPAEVHESGERTENSGNDEVPSYLQDLLQRSLSNIDPKYHQAIKQCLVDFQDVFSSGSHDLGRTNAVRHHIETGNSRPIRQRLRRHPIVNQQEIDRQVKSLVQEGLIEPSDSPWAANVVLVTKKDGTKRLCVDYRGLNVATVKDAYPVPRIDETLDALGGAKWFSTLDLAAGYWQVALDNEAQDKSSFVVRGGLYKWKVMPFGLCNAPATFERLMEKVMAGLQWDILLIYLDDVIVFGRTVDEQIVRLRTTLARLREANLKLKPSKCNLFQQSVKYLGHIVSSEGITTDPAKVETIRNWPNPTCSKDVRSFLGLASYYRKFIRGFASIASPLHELTEKARRFEWNDECQRAFEELKECLIQAPILVCPLPEGDFLLDTDASQNGIGAVLSQIQEGEEKVVAYASKKLSRAERNYCVTRRELLAVVFYLKYFKQYLYGRKLTVRTDHASLQWLLNFKNPEGQLARWIEVIAAYKLTIHHRPGKKHVNADSLSRKPCSQCGLVDDTSDGEDTSTETDTPSEQVQFHCRAIIALPGVTREALREGQLEDDSMSWVLKAKEGRSCRPDWETIANSTAAKKTYWAQWDQLDCKQGVLCRKWETSDGACVKWKVILPRKYRKEYLEAIHGGTTGGHLGVTKTLSNVKQRVHWSGVSGDVRSFIRSCDLCARRKSPSKRARARLQQYEVGEPMERVAMDLVGPLPKTIHGNQWILVVGDYKSKWMEAYALPDARATTVAQKFVEEFVCRFGVPRELHTDQGTNFESQVFAEMCSLLGIRKTRTTAYNPKSDGLIERFNKTLINITAMLIEQSKKSREWDECLPYATSAYRCTAQESTGESPNMLMLGREVTLPIDLTMENPNYPSCDEPKTDYAEKLRQNLQQAHERASECLRKSARRQKRNYDRKTTTTNLKEGQFVWLYDHSKKKGVSPKLQLRWMGPYLVVTKISDVTFRIQLSRRSKAKVVHVDRLKLYTGEDLRAWEYRLRVPEEEFPFADSPNLSPEVIPEEISPASDETLSDDHQPQLDETPADDQPQLDENLPDDHQPGLDLPPDLPQTPVIESRYPRRRRKPPDFFY